MAIGDENSLSEWCPKCRGVMWKGDPDHRCGDRYTVSENPFGYEADVGTARLRYALTDNRPTHVSVWDARERERRLRLTKDGEWVPFRHLCYGPHREDLQALADAMNIKEPSKPMTATEVHEIAMRLDLYRAGGHGFSQAEMDEHYKMLNEEIDRGL